MRKIMACLDAGSNAVKLVVGEMVKKKLNILAVADSPSHGVENGITLNPSDLYEPIREVITRCEEMVGLPIKQMIVCVPSNNATFDVAIGKTIIENEGNLIEGKDISKAIGNAVKHNKRDEDSLYICTMPTSFMLDDQRVVKDPKGLTSKELTMRGVIASTPKENIYPVLACLEKLGIEVIDIALGTIGDYYEYHTKETDNNVGIVVNLGEDHTSLSVFNKGVLTNCKTLNIGGNNVTNDISYVYKVSSETANYLKEKFALAHKNMAQVTEIIELEQEDKIIRINQVEISEIVMSRIQEILKICKNEINCLTKKQISYIIFTGGLTELRDFNLSLEDIFGQTAKVGQIMEIGVRNNKYSSCVGLLKFYANNASLRNKDYSIFSIEEQQILSGVSLDTQNESMIGKLFGYLFNGQ